MRALWTRLHELAASAGTTLPMRGPAREAEIAAAEQDMGIAFPDDFRESLLVHDGQDVDEDGDGLGFPWLPGQPRLASLERIVVEYRADRLRFDEMGPVEERLIERDAIVDIFWHPRRIPIAGNAWWDQDNVYLDLIPGPTGTPGQLVGFGKANFGELIAPSLRIALASYVRALEKGAFAYRDGEVVSTVKKPIGFSKYVAKQR